MRRSAALCLVLLASFALGSAGAQGQASDAVEAAVERLTPEILELRHRIHQYPELGNREFETAKLVVAHLEKLGFENIRSEVAHTGVVAVLEGGKPGPTIAVRADMDALPVTEDTDLPFKSEVRTEYLGQETGVSHACGHDVHTAVQLGVASVLAGMKDELPGTVVFLFQPAEEGPPPGEEGGAKMMMAEDAFAVRPEVVFGLHTYSAMDVGTVGYTSGPAFASVDHFRIDLEGAQSHGAAPHMGVDTVVMAAQVITALQTIRSRTLDPLQPSVVTVGIVRGGTRFNIIPGSVHLEGTVRTYDEGVRNRVEERIDEILAGITAAAGGSYVLDYERITPATINNPALTEHTAPTLARVVGEQNVEVLPPTMGGEDFAIFANEVPGFYYRLGVSHPDHPSGGHHTPEFRADDASVPVGMRVMSQVLLDYLESTPGS
ncbi:MAG: amidohydrolase [Acidobacteriota bacterium]